MKNDKNTTSPRQSRNNKKRIIQNVFFLRHGVAQHNIPTGKSGIGDYTWPNLADPAFTDSSLVTKGMDQARKVGRRLCFSINQAIHSRSEDKEMTLDLVVTSPLSRCLQTASLVLETFNSDDKVMTTKTPVKIICHEGLRESYGKNYSDKRSKKSHLVKSWPNVEFAPEMTEDDLDWHPEYRETMDHLVQRVHDFLFWLISRHFHSTYFPDEENELMEVTDPPTCSVLLITHGVWMESCFMRYCPEVLDWGSKRVHNCNLFRGDLVGMWQQDLSTLKWHCIGMALENIRFLGDGGDE